MSGDRYCPVCLSPVVALLADAQDNLMCRECYKVIYGPRDHFVAPTELSADPVMTPGQVLEMLECLERLADFADWYKGWLEFQLEMQSQEPPEGWERGPGGVLRRVQKTQPADSAHSNIDTCIDTWRTWYTRDSDDATEDGQAPA